MAEREPISLEGVKSYSLKDRPSKVSLKDFGKPWIPGGSMGDWIRSLPGILAGNDFRKVKDRIVDAVNSQKVVILAMGAHGIKVGLNPLIIDLMERGVIGCLAMNGAGIIHDAEIAIVGKTSEDVATCLGEGKFGMAEETGRFLNQAIIEGASREQGLGRAVGEMISKGRFPYSRFSVL